MILSKLYTYRVPTKIDRDNCIKHFRVERCKTSSQGKKKDIGDEFLKFIYSTWPRDAIISAKTSLDQFVEFHIWKNGLTEKSTGMHSALSGR